MQCSNAEIEEKRRQAQLKLLKKNGINNINPSTSNAVSLSENSLNSTNVSNPQFNNFSHKFKSSTKSNTTFGHKPYEKPKPTSNFYPKNNVVTGTCSLISEDKFVVELSAFCHLSIDVFKTIPSKSYNAQTRLWSFDVKDHKLLQEKFIQLKPNVILEYLPKYVLNCCKMPKPDYSKINLNEVDEELVTSLMPFQEEGVCFGIDKRGRCLIADDMGLGKTFQALAIASYYKSDWPLLIATTASMKNVWEETIHKYLPSVSVMYTQYMVSAKDYIGDAKILIVSHDMMSRCVTKLLERRFGVFIVDESHNLKNFKTKCTKAAIELGKKAVRVVLLSGTPALSRPSELYTQLSMIDDKFFGNFFEYSKRYCDGKTTAFGWDANGKSNLQELEIILMKRFMIRRTKEDVLKMLPSKEQEVVQLNINLNQLNETDKESLSLLSQNYKNKKKGNEKHAALLSFFSETAKIKIPAVCLYIKQILETTQKFIVFAHHHKMLDAVQHVLCKKNKKFIRIDGTTTSEQRKYYVDKFQLDDNFVCAILSITAANAGITLTAAKLVIFAELHWNPSILSQAESRAHRIGQEGKVIVRYLLASGTADDSIWPLLQNKQKILKEVGLSKDSFENITVNVQQPTTSDNDSFTLNTTVANTLDITSYFKSPIKEVKSKSLKNTESTEFSDSDNFNDGFANISSAELDFLDDGLDDVLGSVDVNL